MQIPKGYTEEEVLNIINKISISLAHKYSFDIYGNDDIKQEAFILALDGLTKYNGSAPLENFLRKHLSNRLKDFRRDNSYRMDVRCNNCDLFNPECESCCKSQQTQNIKKNLLNPIDIYIANDDKNISYDGKLVDTLEMIEIIDKINKKLPIEYRQDYLRIKEGLYVSKSRKDEIETIIVKIIENEDENE